MRFLLPLSILLALAPLSAQTADEEKPDKVRGRRAWFAATSLPEELENPIRVMTGKDITEIALSKRMASQALKIPADGIIRVVRPAENAGAPGEPAFITLAQVQIPESVQEALVILVPSPDKDGALKLGARVQDLARFKGGDTLYINLTKANVAVKIGDTNIPLRPGAVQIYEAPRLAKPVNTPISYHFFHPKREEWKMISASTIVLRPTRREICIFSWDEGFQRLDYHGITFPVVP